MINEIASAVFDCIYDGCGCMYRNSRATLATANKTLRICNGIRNIFSPMHYNPPLLSLVINTAFYALEFQ